MKRILTLVFIFSSLFAYAQPANDACDNATTIPMTNGVGTASGTTVAATPSPAGLYVNTALPCLAATTVDDVWFKFNTGGTYTDYEVEIDGLVAGANPEFEVWRFITILPNFCTTAGLQAIVDCQTSSPTAAQKTELLLTGLSPNTDYYIRVNTWGTSMAFNVNVNKYIPPVLINDPINTPIAPNNDCVGTLFDSGGPTGDYGSLENLDYTICPTDPHTCVVLDVVNYQFEPFPATDRLEFYTGSTVDPNNFFSGLCDQGSATITIPDSCITVRFRSDGTTEAAGFQINWSCTSNCPPAQPVSHCYAATDVTTLPYTQTGFSTCGAGNQYNSTDACGSGYMDGQDYVFSYTTAGDECIKIELSNTATNTGVFVFDGCPNADATKCVEKFEAPFGNPVINSVQLEDAGTYYIVVSSEVGCSDCTGFDIAITDSPCPLKVDDNVPADSLVKTIAAQGVAVQNAILDCPQGAYGVFSGGVTDNQGALMDGGIVLSSGRALGAEGPSSLFSDIAIGSGPDSLLTLLAGQPTLDKCFLQFEVFAPKSELSFNYLFGSEEYNEFVNNIYNDIFGFFVSGPGITGEINLAVLPPPALPNTSITINTINNGNPFGSNPNSNPNFYMNNTVADGPAPNADVLGYDGHTVIMSAETTVIPCNWYTIRLGIADGTDPRFDSGVLIEANSLFSNAATISSNGADGTFDNTINAAEACADGQFTIDLFFPQIDTATVYIQVASSSTASPNDYNSTVIPDSVVFAPGQTVITIPIVATVDGVAEGPETIVLYLLSECATAEPYDSAVLIIRDELDVSLDPAITICGEPITMPFVANGADYTFWSPGVGLSDSTISNPLVSPDTVTTYTIIASNGVCHDTLSTTITPTLFTVAGDTTYCEGGTSSITSSTNIATGVTYSWTGANGAAPIGLSCTDCPQPNVSGAPVGNNQYIVTYTAPSCTVIDTINVNVIAYPNPTVSGTGTLCENESYVLGGTPEPGVTYTWTDQTTGLVVGNTLDLEVTPQTSTTYELVASNGNCEVSGNTVTVDVFGSFTLDTNPDEEINIGNSVDVTTTATQNGVNPIGALSYVWTPPTGVSDASIANPVMSPTTSTVYTVTATSSAGCSQTASFEITVNTPFYNVPNAFTPNNDGENDKFKVLAANGANYEIKTFNVFNRWGQLVYSGLSQDGWDGTIDGKIANQATYIYQIVIQLPDGRTEDFNGEVLLVR